MASRDQTIDLIRGYCIVSMVTGHLAGFLLLAGIFHVFPKFDGASGFVLLGGLVLGMVERRRVLREGLAAVPTKSVRRLGLIYGAQVALVVVGVVAAFSGWDSHNFLIHASVVEIARQVALPAVAAIPFIVVVSLGLAWLLHRCVEQPSIRFGCSVSDRRAYPRGGDS